MSPHEPARMDRRVAIKWMLAASAGVMLARSRSPGAPPDPAARPARGYGSDPDLMRQYKPWDEWALTLSGHQRTQAGVLADIIIPADARSPSASSVGVVDFIDEWVSAPYPDHQADAKAVSDGLAWLEAESLRRFGAPFAGAHDSQRALLCEELSHDPPANPGLRALTEFFRLFRNLTATGFYTSPVGVKDLGYVGNVPLARFDGPPAELIEKLGLRDEVTW